MRRSPQEKKALSYAKDRQNTYGENDKSSRKNIPLRKRLVNRANRHAVQQRLDDAVGPLDAERAERAEVCLRGTRGKTWRKSPDEPLGQVLARKRQRAEGTARYLSSWDKGGSVERTVRTPDGRTLAVEESGDPAGRPVLVHTGTPNSRHLYGLNVRDAAARGLRLISYDRPGYGGSSPQPGRTVADCAGDVRAICAELGIGRLATWGISGGGPHVLACAALLPDLVTAAAALASLAPYGAEGLDYFAGMGQGNVDDFRLFLADEAAARAQTDKDREELLATSPEDFAKGVESLLAPADAAVLRGELAGYLTSSAQDGLAPGSQGWHDDNCTLRPWGFDLAGLTVPVLLLHGRQDKFVPFGHGEWLAAHIPGVEARLLDDDGHLTLLQNRVPEVHAWLAEHL